MLHNPYNLLTTVDITSMLTYNDQLSDELHEKDRVHTYGSFYIADLGA